MDYRLCVVYYVNLKVMNMTSIYLNATEYITLFVYLQEMSRGSISSYIDSGFSAAAATAKTTVMETYNS